MVGSGYRDADLVFAMPDGEPWNPDTITQAFDRLVRASGLSRIRLHDLRHSHATHLLAAGANVKMVSDRMGTLRPRSRSTSMGTCSQDNRPTPRWQLRY
jgi:integrase